MKHSNIAIFIPHSGCPHQCSFCNQRTISGQASSPSPEEVSGILRQAKVEIADPANTEIAFFGGSFTAVPASYRRTLLKAAEPFLGEDGFSGIRISTRPDAIDREVLSELKEAGVTAIELGAQSMRNEVLSANGRGHTAEQVRTASALIREQGFSLGLQMMTGLYQDDREGALFTARELAECRPDTMRIYPVAVLKGTELGRLWEAGIYRPMELAESVDLCAELLWYFHLKGIRVIKAGLHASAEVEANRLAGAYHPAFRELCEQRIYRERAMELLSCIPGADPVTIGVSPRAVSKMAGQKRENILLLEKETGRKLRIRGRAGLAEYEIILVEEEEGQHCF